MLSRHSVSKTKELKELDSELAQITNYSTVAAIADTFTLDIANSRFINFRIETEDVTAKTVAIENVPTEAEILIELEYINAAAITWFTGVAWKDDVIPLFAAGKKYRILLFTSDGGTTYNGVSVGEW